MAPKKKSRTATRKHVLRSDASIRAGQKTIAAVFGLPREAARLVKPNGRRMRSDASVQALLRAWDWA